MYSMEFGHEYSQWRPNIFTNVKVHGSRQWQPRICNSVFRYCVYKFIVNLVCNFDWNIQFIQTVVLKLVWFHRILGFYLSGSSRLKHNYIHLWWSSYIGRSILASMMIILSSKVYTGCPNDSVFTELEKRLNILMKTMKMISQQIKPDLLTNFRAVRGMIAPRVARCSTRQYVGDVVM